MKKTKWFILFMSFQIIILSLLGLSWFITGVQGKEIRLHTELFDPNDIFYGDYLALNYKVNKVPVSLWKGNKKEIYDYSKKGVYVSLIQKKDLWEVDGVYPSRERVVSKNRIVLKALLAETYDPSELGLTYGIERFYIQEKSGKKWENMTGPLVAVIRVSPWGQLRVMHLLTQR